MSRRARAGTTHRPSRRRWRLPPSRAADDSPACRAVRVHPNQITAWKAQLEGGASGVFGRGSAVPATPATDVKSLHAKTGELTLENDS